MGKKSDQKGMVLIYALMISVILAIICTSISTFSASNFFIASKQRDRITALQSAEAGICRAIYEVNNDSDWAKYVGDPMKNPLSVSFPDSNSAFTAYLYRNLDSKKKMIGYKNEIIPPRSAQIVSIGEAGPLGRRTKRTLVCLLKISTLDTCALASTGSMNAVDGDLMVDGIDSIATWNPIAGNIHANTIVNAPSTSFVWNGKGVYECNITGKITTLSKADTIKFYQNDGVPYSKTFNTMGDQNVTLPDPFEGMRPPADTSTLLDLPAPDPVTGDIILEEGKSYKFIGNKANALTIEGKLIMNNSKLYIIDSDLIIKKGLKGDGIVSVSGWIDHDNFDYWQFESEKQTGTETVLVETRHEPPPDQDDGEHRGLISIFPNNVTYLTQGKFILASYESTTRKDSFNEAILTEAILTADSSPPSLDDYPPGSTWVKTPTDETQVTTEKREKSQPLVIEEPDGQGGKWIYIYKEYDIYEVTTRKYNYSVSRPAGATITGDVDFDTSNVGGASIYTQGLLTLNGAENEMVLSKIMKALKDKIDADINADPPAASESQLISDYFKNTMVITVDGVDYSLNGIEEWLEAHPALKYKTLESFKAENSVVLSAIAQYITKYLYFQGVIYTQGGFVANNKIKVIGGIIAKDIDPNQHRAYITLKKGALITCNGEYLRSFHFYTKKPTFAPLGWHEVY